MATITPVMTRPNDDAIKVTWSAIANGDTIQAFHGFSEYADRSVQVGGTIDSSTVVIQGSNDGTTFATLNDPLGNALSFTSAGLKAILEYVEFIKIATSGGGGSQNVDVTLIAKRR